MLRNVPAGTNLVVLTFCKGGKHRAYAMRWILKRVLKEIYDQECGVIDCSRTVNWRNTCGMCTECAGTTEDSDSWRTWAKSRACTLWREALEDPRGYGETKKGRGRSKSPAATATWEPKGSVSPAPNAARGSGDGLVDRVKAEKANRERKASRGAEKRASSARQKKDKAASSTRDVKMKDDDQDEFVDDMSFVEDLSLDDGYDLSDIVNWDMPELEKIAYVFLHRLFAVFRPTETSAVDGIMKKYSDELIALMGCVAKKYVDGTQAANMLKAVLNLKTVDPESFGSL